MAGGEIRKSWDRQESVAGRLDDVIFNPFHLSQSVHERAANAKYDALSVFISVVRMS